ncbi:MAG: hypothetical protein IKT81_00030 [Clostridia bacterium]|nr:hypothetical protein [Clostridia bacterium]
MEKVSEIIRRLSGGEIRVGFDHKIRLPRNFDGRHWNMQGGCSDGRYAYYALNTGGDSTQSVTRIVKIDTETWQVVQTSGDMYISHSNDMVFDPYNNRLIVSWCDIEPDKVGIVDPDTLTLKETLTIPQRHYSMGYCSDKNEYVAGISRTYDLAVLDARFNVQRVLPGVEGYTKQGIDCDSELIYFLHSVRGESGTYVCNLIFTFDWDGRLISRILVPYAAEAENLFTMGDKIVCAFNDKHTDEAVISVLSLS